jgi:hypothetical protein
MTGAGPTLRGASLLAVALLAVAPGASAQWVIENGDGTSGIQIGFLAQPQAEWLETPAGDGYSQNLFLRRFRILFGGHVTEKWSFFFETDSPNVGKANPDVTANPTGAKDAGTVFIQDALVTYTHNAAFKVDAGLQLLPLSHNHEQSAATLLPVDYGPYTFLESGPTGERVGRDYGVQLRGYPAKQHLEYRVGVFSGFRGEEARNALRVAARVAWYPWAAETGYFYAGTFQGSRKLLGIGASADTQKDYHSYGADLFYEQPLNEGRQGLSVQFDFVHVDGAGSLSSLSTQDTYLFEAGVHLARGRFTPFVQYASRDLAGDSPDQDSLQVGLAWWWKGHNRNLKASAGRLHTDGQPDRVQALVQLQIYYY